MSSFLFACFALAVTGMCVWYFSWKKSDFWFLKGLALGVVASYVAKFVFAIVFPFLLKAVGLVLAIVAVIVVVLAVLGIWARALGHARQGAQS
ncbi:MAG: hypothetical protein V1723_02510 [Candidatus Uhrbacteria bacterium]